ncbi:hypothetical protein GOODEAATRI_000990, partial [Goodea atripinnis]
LLEPEGRCPAPIPSGVGVIESHRPAVCCKFTMHFGDTIDGSRTLDTEVRGRVTWRGRTKRSNGTGDKETKAVLQGQV